MSDGSAERRLWTEVLHRAWHDHRPGGPLAEREKVRWWLGSRDFVACCELAGLDPDAVRAAFKKQRRP